MRSFSCLSLASRFLDVAICFSISAELCSSLFSLYPSSISRRLARIPEYSNNSCPVKLVMRSSPSSSSSSSSSSSAYEMYFPCGKNREGSSPFSLKKYRNFFESGALIDPICLWNSSSLIGERERDLPFSLLLGAEAPR